MSKTADNSEKVRWWPFWLILLFVVSSWFVFVIEWFPWWTEENARGTFGDSFGVISALFSGLAFAGVICAILLQKKELELQRKELEDTRAEIRGQNETLQKQNFESSFFQLLGLHNDIVNSMQIQDKACSGRECFGHLLNHLQIMIYPDLKVAQSSEDDSLERECLNTKYEEFFRVHQSFMGQYVGHLYNVVQFVHEHEFFAQKGIKEKKQYIKFIHTQLSNNELGLLFFYGLSDQETEPEFKNLVEKYAFFQYLSSEVLIAADYRAQFKDDRSERLSDNSYKEYIQKLRGLYVPSAYGESE